jgi:hypothetical protein
MADLLSIVKKYCAYEITDYTQTVDFEFDIEKLRREVFKFILDNDFGFSEIVTRLPKGESPKTKADYTDGHEGIGAIAFNPYELNTPGGWNSVHPNVRNKETLYWHPDLENSYLASLVPQLEKLCGFEMGRVRLVWIMPNSGYPMHFDLEPMKLHIPLITNDLVYFMHDHKITRMPYAKVTHLVTTKIHTVWNYGNLPRLHLVFSTVGNDEFDKDVDDSRITEIEAKEKNLYKQLNHQGVDKYSLIELLKIGKSAAADFASAEKEKEFLYSIKQISALLEKAN